MKEHDAKMKHLVKVDPALRQREEGSVALATFDTIAHATTFYEQTLCIQHLFEAQVVRTPAAPALVAKEETLSYDQLNRRANRLAHRLQLLGVGPEVLVGLCLPRTPDLLIALLAILKAGGAYVPLDPAYPADRLRFQIQDSGAHLLLTTSSLEHLWQEIEVTRLYLDQSSKEDYATPSHWETNLEIPAHEDHLAYVIYTSGSTGRPKGVCIAHRNTKALIDWAFRHYTLEDVQGMVAGTSICFDLSIFELFVPWSCGGTVYLVENGLHLPEGAAREQASLLNMVPSVMAELARTTTLPTSVRVITFCGETLPRPLVEHLYNLPGVERIYNLYGPTEDTTYSTWSLLDRDEHGENVPIGQPLNGSQVYLLDQDGQQVPYGAIGEIYLGGAGVTRGYWNRPEMTAQRFLPDPFGTQRGARLYRSGDLARYRADGQLEFLGRIDQQVKIRGHRIELGEIESVLRQHTEVQDCVVLARQPASGTYLILVAYVVPKQPHKDLEHELQTFLQQRLPDYMLPTFFVPLETLPKTSNGKIDRQALPDPYVKKERKQPRPTQTKLTQALNLSNGKKELFKKLLKKEYTSSSAPLVPELEQAPEPPTGKELFPLSFPQQRYWLIDQLDPGTPLYNIFFASRVTGKLNTEAMIRTFHEIVRRHETLRTAFLKVDGIPMQQICPPSNFPIPIIDLRSLSPEQQKQEEQRLLKQETQASFDLSQGLLLRANMLQLTDTLFTLMINMHHIASDGISTDVFREELAALYEAFSQGRPSPLPSLPIRYTDYVLWHHQRLQGALLEEQLTYWKHQLANPPGPLHLPTDRPRSARQTFNGRIYRFHLPHSLFRSLQALGQSEGVTLFMTLFAGFQTLLCRLSGQEDILVGTPIANRTRAGLEQMIGCFVNTVVFRTDMQDDPTFRALLQRVRTMALGAYGHQDISFEQVLHALRTGRDSAHAFTPLFQVMFHFHLLLVSPDREVELSVERLEQKNMAAKFDLSLRIKVYEAEDGMALEAEFLYNTDLFDHTTIIRFAQSFHCLLDDAVAHPDQNIWHLSLVPEQERERLIAQSNTDQRADSPQQDEHSQFDHALATTQSYILDRSLQLMPVHMPGELYSSRPLSDANVARDNSSASTQATEQSIDNPFSADPDARLYKTGDLARYLPDGTIEIIGRFDDHVKIRGFWLQLSAVQTSLSQHPAIHAVAVIAREDTPGDQHLVAYVVPQEHQTITTSDLHEYASHHLPAHMVPTTSVVLEALPMTSDGQVDRQALPAPQRVRTRTEGQIGPHSDIEAKLIHMWESLLQISPIGGQDNFFDLGGNSLVAVRLMAQIQREFQQDLPISVLFQKATPEQMTTELLRRRWSNIHSALVEIQPTGTKLPFFCVHPVGGEVFCYATLARQLGPEQPLYGLQVPRHSHQQLPSQTIEEMAHSYIVELQTIQPSGPYLLGGWSMGGVIAFEMAQQLVQQGQKVALLALIDSDAPTNRPSPTKTLVQRFGEELEGVFSKLLTIDYTQFQDLSLEEQLIQLYLYAEQADMLPPDLEFEHLLSMFSIYQRNVEALRHYQPRGYSGQLTLFTATPSEESHAVDRTHGWQTLAPQEFALHIVPGDHYSMLKKPNVHHLVELLQHHFAAIG